MEGDVAMAALAVLFGVVMTLNVYLSKKSVGDSKLGRLLSGENAQTPARRFLVVTAHPDDECMFFAPTIQNLNGRGIVYLLCLSNGNADGLGAVRELELRESAARLGLDSQDVAIVDDPALQDGQSQQWPAAAVAQYVQQCVNRWNIDLVATFDRGGVSGHPNHIAVSQGVGLAAQMGTGKRFDVYELETVSTACKYLGLFYAWLVPTEGLLFVSTFASYTQARSAMFAHHSQLVWFRRLYIFFSAYMCINHLRAADGRAR